MKFVNVMFVRVYLREADKTSKIVLNYLKNQAKVRGVSVFRAISGFSDTSEHTSFLVDLSLDLPITIEFFDTENIVNPALEYLATVVDPEHIVFWEAKANDR